MNNVISTGAKRSEAKWRKLRLTKTRHFDRSGTK